MDLLPLLNYCQGQQDAMLRLLKQLVERESPSSSKEAVDRLGAHFATELRRVGGRVQLHPSRKWGNTLRARFWHGLKAKPILLLGHLDTVWELGTLRKMPFRVRGGRAYGPGIYDMKSGLVCAVFALRAMRALKLRPRRPTVLLFDADEEISSLAARRLIQAEARKSHCVLVLEPAADLQGSLKTARKGVGEFRLVVKGRAAHAGVNPGAGTNAISELAQQIQRVEREWPIPCRDPEPTVSAPTRCS